MLRHLGTLVKKNIDQNFRFLGFSVFKFVLAATSVQTGAPTVAVYAVSICVLLKPDIFSFFVFLTPIDGFSL